MSAMVEAPAHLAELRRQLEELIARAADEAAAASRLEQAAAKIKTAELWLKQGSPMLGAVDGAIAYALGFTDNSAYDPLDVAQAGQDAIDVLDLAISRVDDASWAGAS